MKTVTKQLLWILTAVLLLVSVAFPAYATDENATAVNEEISQNELAEQEPAGHGEQRLLSALRRQQAQSGWESSSARRRKVFLVNRKQKAKSAPP